MRSSPRRLSVGCLYHQLLRFTSLDNASPRLIPFNAAGSRNVHLDEFTVPHTMILRRTTPLVMSTLLSSLYGGSLAQAAATSSASGASSTPTIHKVTVGGGNSFTYDPNTTFAAVGDIVVFEFLPTNHSVIRAEYTGSNACGSTGCNPCVPYELIHPGEAGFFSGNFLTQNADPNSVSILSRI